jgi:ADP-ribose pyrophosphatase YjhB (NUDIX family)
MPQFDEVARIPLVMGEIPGDQEAQARRGWALRINGQEYTEPVRILELVQASMGVTLTYGLRPEGYDAPVIHEPGGGGSVTIPFMLHPDMGQIFAGVVEEKRAGQGGKVFNVPRGFLVPGETHQQGAVRGVAQETGLQVLARRFIRLAEGQNPNSAFFDTSGTLPSGEPEGVQVYGLPLRLDELDEHLAADGAISYTFPDATKAIAGTDKIAKRILGSKLIPLSEALTSEDLFTQAAAGALWRHLAFGALYGGGMVALPQRSRPDEGQA